MEWVCHLTPLVRAASLLLGWLSPPGGSSVTGEGSESFARVAVSPPGGSSVTGEGSESVARVVRLESEPCEVLSLEVEVERCRKHLQWLRPPNLVGMEANAYCWGTVYGCARILALYAVG